MRSTLIVLFFLMLLGVSSTYAEQALGGKQPVTDVRVLIDISGSMKKNDPQNLRVPALKLVTQLLPEGTKAGVWTFGEFVNMLVPSGEVNQAWKAKAKGAAKAINSSGKYTNIEGVLKDSTWDWNKPDPKTSRHIIFLTDGMLDMSKDEAVDQAARGRILGEMLTRMKNNGVIIHTVALSGEADKPFLRQLSAATSGRYEEVGSAAELERVFLRMFEKAVPVESLPLVGNKVLVDNSVNELTMLVFRKEGVKSASLKMPDGKEIDPQNKPDGVQWQREDRYDLITIDDYLVRVPSKTSLVRVKGDSMIDAGIHEGDLLVVEQQPNANVGEIVVAIVNNEFTVKILDREKDGFVLKPANKAYPVIRPRGGFEIFGVMAGLVRRTR